MADVEPRKSSLAAALSYQNPEILWRFMDDWGVSSADAEDIFLETKRWLWLCARNNPVENGGLPLLNGMIAMDEMWHTFILFTQDYSQYCKTHFGFYIHHQPTPKAEKGLKSEKAKIERKKLLERTYSFIYDELGPDTLVHWCREFPKRFPEERFK